MKYKLLVVFFILLSTTILFRENLFLYFRSLSNQTPIIHSYLNTCSDELPLTLCRLIYNKFSFVVSERIISFLGPISVENAFMVKNSFPYVLFPFYLLGIFSLFWKRQKYLLWAIGIFLLLYVRLLSDWPITSLVLLVILGIGIKEFWHAKKNLF